MCRWLWKTLRRRSRPDLEPGRLGGAEDDITALLKELLSTRLEQAGWWVPDQSRGGTTAARNAGERDLVIKRGNIELAPIEAVIARDHVPHKELRRHFHRLLAYGDSPIFFHLTYARLDRMTDLLASLEEAARENAPDGHRFLQLEHLRQTGDQPRGFVATYETPDDRKRVVFLALYFKRKRQSQAAAASLTI